MLLSVFVASIALSGGAPVASAYVIPAPTSTDTYGKGTVVDTYGKGSTIDTYGKGASVDNYGKG